MADLQIYLYPPGATPQEYTAASYVFKDGMLVFRTKGTASLPVDTEIRTTVPFTIRGQVSKVPVKGSGTG
jgi:hypothetical protein